MTFYSYVMTPVGRLLLMTDGEALTGLHFVDLPKSPEPAADWVEDDSKFAEAHRQLEEYFDGKREDFDLPLAPIGTPFQVAVWNALREIGYGRTASYRDIAVRVGKPNAVRAVGTTNGRNPIAIIIPCHRVIGADGRLTGYGGGLPVKEQLLRLEGALSLV